MCASVKLVTYGEGACFSVLSHSDDNHKNDLVWSQYFLNTFVILANLPFFFNLENRLQLQVYNRQ